MVKLASCSKLACAGLQIVLKKNGDVKCENNKNKMCKSLKNNNVSHTFLKKMVYSHRKEEEMYERLDYNDSDHSDKQYISHSHAQMNSITLN